MTKVDSQAFTVLVPGAWGFYCVRFTKLKFFDVQHSSVVTFKPRTSIIAELCSLIRTLLLRC